MKYTITLLNQLKKLTKESTKESTKKSLIENLSKRLLESKFEENHSIKLKCLKYIVKELLSSL